MHIVVYTHSLPKVERERERKRERERERERTPPTRKDKEVSGIESVPAQTKLLNIKLLRDGFFMSGRRRSCLLGRGGAGRGRGRESAILLRGAVRCCWDGTQTSRAST